MHSAKAHLSMRTPRTPHLLCPNPHILAATRWERRWRHPLSDAKPKRLVCAVARAMKIGDNRAVMVSHSGSQADYLLAPRIGGAAICKVRRRGRVAVAG